MPAPGEPVRCRSRRARSFAEPLSMREPARRVAERKTRLARPAHRTPGLRAARALKPPEAAVVPPASLRIRAAVVAACEPASEAQGARSAFGWHSAWPGAELGARPLFVVLAEFLGVFQAFDEVSERDAAMLVGLEAIGHRVQ